MSQVSRFINFNQPIESIIGNDGIVIPPFYDGTRWDVFIIGAGHINTTGNIALSTLTINLDGGIADTYITDNGAANPINYILEIFGGSNINTEAPLVPGNRIVINLNDNVHITGTFIADGDITSSAGNISATLGQVNAGTTMTAGTGITATTGDITATAGNVVITAGNLNLPNTNAAGTEGEITFGGNRWISNFGTENTFVGQNSGNTTLTVTDAYQCTGVGMGALASLQLGRNNTAIGWMSGNAISGAGQNNTALGSGSLGVLTTGSRNTTLGTASGPNLLTGDDNIIIGDGSGVSYNAAQSSNICIGNIGLGGDDNIIRLGTDGNGAGQQTDCYIAGTTHITRNLAMPNTNVGGTIGVITFGGAPYIHNYGTNNFFLGDSAGDDAVTLTGTQNVCLGRGCLQNLTTGNENTAVGDHALLSVSTGSSNVALGSAALAVLLVGNDNIAIGTGAGVAYTNAQSSNILIGNAGNVLDNNTIRIGTDGNGIGQQADCYIAGNTRVTRNLMLPNTAPGAPIVGEIQFGGNRWISNFDIQNTFVGELSGNTVTTGGAGGNTGIAYRALNAVTSGENNSALGADSGLLITTGSRNTSLGAGSLSNLLTGARNIALGFDASVNYVAAESSNICIGHGGTITENNTIHIGTPGGGVGEQNRTFIAGIRGVAPATTDAGIVVIASDHQLGSTGAMTDGQLLIGSTGANPVLNNLTSGSGISIGGGPGTITIDAIGGGLAWSTEAANIGAVFSHGYIANGAGTVVFTLPANSVVGDLIRVTGMNNATGWRIAQNAGQTIHFGASNTTTGVGGYLESTAIYDAVEIVCNIADTDWIVLSSIGNITIV